MYDVAFIGTGPDPETPVWGESAAMAYRHATGYDDHERCALVACADVVEEHARAFADRNGIDDENVFTDYERMLEAVDPDVVSVCTPVPTHEELVVGCAARDGLAAIHCEKPMAATMGGARRMVDACEANGVQLTFNHQRRVATPSRMVADLIGDGVIGDVTRVELSAPNLFDGGTHLVDLANYFVGDRPASWAIAQLDYREENVRYGVHNENQALARWRYEGGVDAIAAAGDPPLADCDVRVLGTRGAIELDPPGEAQLRVDGAGTDDWDEVVTDEPLADVSAAIADVVAGLETGAEPQLSARRALAATELIFACYESARRRARVNLPLSIEDNPLASMVEEGALEPRPADD